MNSRRANLDVFLFDFPVKEALIIGDDPHPLFEESFSEEISDVPSSQVLSLNCEI